MKNKVFLLLFLFFNIQHSSAYTSGNIREHTDNNNAWIMYFGNIRLNERLGLYSEIQWRRNDIIENPQQILLRTGINYHLKDRFVFTAGYCFVETSPYGAFPVKGVFPEHRLWEQLQIKTNTGALEWLSRFRIEQRFTRLPVESTELGTFEPGQSVYTNRFRLMNRLSFPLKGKEISEGKLYFSVYDEIFINFGENVGLNLLDQNRAYAAIGYVVPKFGRVELGFLEQTLVKSDGIKIEDNHTLQLSIYTVIDKRK